MHGRQGAGWGAAWASEVTGLQQGVRARTRLHCSCSVFVLHCFTWSKNALRLRSLSYWLTVRPNNCIGE